MAIREMVTRASAGVLVLGLFFASHVSALAQSPTPPPQDVAYPGTITLSVDATDLDRRIFTVHETIPVKGGETLTLLYPQWLPGQHSPNGRADKLAGLIIRAGETRLEWTRDPGDIYAFRVNVPAHASTLDVAFQFMSPMESSQGRVFMAQDLLSLSWDTVVLYPAGYYARQITVAATARLPIAWPFGTALEVDSNTDNLVTFKPVSLETLADSPILAGRYFKRIDLGASGPAPVRLNVAADSRDVLDAKPAQIAIHRMLVEQATKLFGAQHFAHYDFLLGLTDDLTPIGLEHHQSSENIVAPTYFTEWDKTPDRRDLLAHEMVHSWNGKFRRPADLWTPNYNVPMRDSLLWVYEGQTEYWGMVLAARAGLFTKQQALDDIASIAGTLDNRVGRTWRSLQDTTNDPVMSSRRGLSSRSWQRQEDYYGEGLLIWLDADTLIRELSHGRKSLDDFAHAFFGVENGRVAPLTYTFDDVVAALNAIQPYDWAGFFRARLDGHGPGAPLDGVKRGGYKLVYRETPTDFSKLVQARRKYADLSYSLGLIIGKDGKISDVMRDGVADKAMITTNSQILAVNGIAYDEDKLKDAITAAKTNGALELIVKTGDRFRTVRLNYRDGLRFPQLERDTAGTARLDEILQPR